MTESPDQKRLRESRLKQGGNRLERGVETLTFRKGIISEYLEPFGLRGEI